MLTKERYLQETVKSDNGSKYYIGSTGGTLKTRWYSHISDIRNVNNNGTELSKHIWNLKNNDKQYELSWEIIHHMEK